MMFLHTLFSSKLRLEKLWFYKNVSDVISAVGYASNRLLFCLFNSFRALSDEHMLWYRGFFLGMEP